MTHLYNQGKVTITHRHGDIYFGRVLQNLPPLPKVYLRFMPQDYESQISDEERTIRFLCIGSPSEKNYLRLDGTPGKTLKFLLGNIGMSFKKRDIEETLSIGNLDTVLPDLGTRINQKSSCFKMSREAQGREALYTLTQTDPPQSYLEKLEELDRECGLNKVPKDSLDSAKL